MDVSRHVSAALWVVVVAWLSRSVWRDMRGQAREIDKPWTIGFAFGVLQIGFYLRWMFRTPVPFEGDLDRATLLGLNVWSMLIALAIMWRRHVREGWRW